MAATLVEQYHKIAGLEYSTKIAPCVCCHLTFQWLNGFLSLWLDNTHAAQYCLDLPASQQARQEVVLSTNRQQPNAAESWV
jgi:hypothetical protein